MNRVIITLTIALIVLMTPVSSLAQSATAVQPIGDAERRALYPTRAMIEQGRAVVESACVGCHGMDGISDAQGKPHLAGQRAVYLYRVLQAFQNATRPDEENQHNKFLTDGALLAATVYYSSLTPVAGSEVNDETSKTGLASLESGLKEEDPFDGIRASMKKCIKCHEVSGNSDSNGMPSLTAQSPEYFVTSMLSYIDGSRSHKLMKKLVGRLNVMDINEMGVYYAVQQPLRTENPGEGDVNVGRRLAKECESCHGENGNATKDKMPTLAGQDAKYFVKAMKHYKDGERLHEKMFEAVKDLSEQDMLDLATFYAGEEPRSRDVRMPLKSAEWIVRCERCHGIDGNSTDPRFPMLAGQDVTYLRNALRAYAIDERQSTTMHAMADPLSPRDIERIGTYFAAQKPKAVVYMQLPCGNDQQK
jgi:cytochrome c553